MKETIGAEALVLAGNRFYKRIILEPLIDAVVEEGGLVNMPLNLKMNSGLEIPIYDIFLPMAPSEPSNN